VVPTLEHFLTALEPQDPRETDPRWRPQHLNLLHPLVEFDLIGRLETFDTDLKRVQGATGTPELPMHVRNLRPRKDSLFDGRRDLWRRVREVYALDLGVVRVRLISTFRCRGNDT
jgi:hypothetical protein